MTRQLKWGLGVLVLIIVGFIALQIFLYIGMQNFKERIADRPKVEPQTPTMPNVVFSEEKPMMETNTSSPARLKHIMNGTPTKNI